MQLIALSPVLLFTDVAIPLAKPVADWLARTRPIQGLADRYKKIQNPWAAAAVPFSVFAPLFALKVFALHTVLGIHSLWPSAIMEAFENLSLSRFAIGAGLILGAKVVGGLTAVKLWCMGREAIRKSPLLSKADDFFSAVGHVVHKALDPVSAALKAVMAPVRNAAVATYAKLRHGAKEAGTAFRSLLFGAPQPVQAQEAEPLPGVQRHAVPRVPAPVQSAAPAVRMVSVPQAAPREPNMFRRFIAAGCEVFAPMCRKIAAHRPARVLMSMDGGQKPFCLRFTR